MTAVVGIIKEQLAEGTRDKNRKLQERLRKRSKG